MLSKGWGGSVAMPARRTQCHAQVGRGGRTVKEILLQADSPACGEPCLAPATTRSSESLADLKRNDALPPNQADKVRISTWSKPRGGIRPRW